MAKRIGKYKVSAKDSELSLADGGTVDGNLVIGGTLKFSSLGTTNPAVAGQIYSTGSVKGGPVELGAITGSGFLVLASQG